MDCVCVYGANSAVGANDLLSATSEHHLTKDNPYQGVQPLSIEQFKATKTSP